MAKFAKPSTHSQLVQPTSDLNADIGFLENIGFELDQIFPADNPQVAVLSGHSLTIRLDRNVDDAPSRIRLLTDDPDQFAILKDNPIAPNGSRFEVHRLTYKLNQPKTKHRFEVRKLQDGEPWVIGRAGMQYRDLIPDRLGGSIIASHIRIPEGGPVPDVVHYHTIGFQLIFCYKGWVKLVYEDQGDPFVLTAGDCVTQPPEIRHRVLEASDHLEVIEIGVPSDHMTTIDHDMVLPNDVYNPDRIFQGQKFCHHKSGDAKWTKSRMAGLQHRDTGVHSATNGVASVLVHKSAELRESVETSHQVDILFCFVMQGNLMLSADDYDAQTLRAGEAFVIPPDFTYRLSNVSKDIELLEVSLPGINE